MLWETHQVRKERTASGSSAESSLRCHLLMTTPYRNHKQLPIQALHIVTLAPDQHRVPDSKDDQYPTPPDCRWLCHFDTVPTSSTSCESMPEGPRFHRQPHHTPPTPRQCPRWAKRGHCQQHPTTTTTNVEGEHLNHTRRGVALDTIAVCYNTHWQYALDTWVHSPHLHTAVLTSQYCTAVSFDTRNAIARFPGQLWYPTHARVGVPLGFVKPLP